ncbi:MULTISPECIES: heme NO-binding domain-containing protein [Rhizobium/Agrobacterium group]|uniref:Guanylate cyclase-related protein n=2 Tax=Rhizobium/Agrobacterium group TaxID=227290 RepID=B9JYX7_ALLAM|nr:MULTISPECIES: heme NO-binding domain-containing protein [Rhizobium/Agrobacterium group]ACM37223.1 Guanylate cyclase-related protein [Allorhizobium ampelinum S4]MCF1448924.1 hypothetical protein [Allorhizobium ampelinum]MCF1492445.1 hypothetical protein [Allorhizobium ampelinum]MUO31465.1 hypothetical protein [Agrobacterium vitis]MUO45327.1 hypothetical protein [Agrobacterium vitis]
MKGMVFTEMLEFVAATWNEDMADDIIEASLLTNGLASGGAYTSVGTYDHREMMALLAALSQRSGLGVDALMQAFGLHLAGRFAVLFPGFFDRSGGLFGFLASIDAHIHVEVKKLYPDAELPSFEILSQDGTSLSMLYRSGRKMEALAEGLIQGAARHFGSIVKVERSARDDGATLFVIAESAS